MAEFDMYLLVDFAVAKVLAYFFEVWLQFPVTIHNLTVGVS